MPNTQLSALELQSTGSFGASLYSMTARSLASFSLYHLTQSVSTGTMTAEQEKESCHENSPNLGSFAEGNRSQRQERQSIGARIGGFSPDNSAVSIRRARYSAGDSRQAGHNPRS